MPKEEIHHYDLFDCPEGWTAKSILIVSPYVEEQFFERLISEMRPKLLTVVIDDGCRPEDVQMLRRFSGNKTKFVVALGSAPGLVHSKIFHTEWRMPKGYRAHTLVYGSGNGTHQAFGGDFNSELLCWSRLKASHNYDTLDWLAQIRAAASNPEGGVRVAALRTELADGVYFRLPEITDRDAASKADNFDLWLQRGHLLSAYRPDTGFLRVALPLEKKLPPGDLEKKITDAGIEIPGTSRLSIQYVPVSDVTGEGGRWRSQLFTETDLGDWCSEACYKEKKHLFRRNGYEKREESLQRLEMILTNDKVREKARSDYLGQVENLWRVFGPSAGSYLKSAKNGVDVDHYRGEFKDRLNRDAKLAKDGEFRSRYLNGFAVVPVPRFRIDTAAWATFREYFVAQLHYDSLKQRQPGLLLRRIKSALGKGTSQALSPEKLSSFLDAHWNKPAIAKDADGLTVGAYIDRYHLGKFDDAEED
jgi:hypothetical protein